jgi:hypothetical protein
MRQNLTGFSVLSKRWKRGPQQPFNRFSDTSETHEVELNFRYIIQVSLHHRLLTDKATGDARPEESRNLKVKTSKKSPGAK